LESKVETKRVVFRLCLSCWARRHYGCSARLYYL